MNTLVVRIQLGPDVVPELIVQLKVDVRHCKLALALSQGPAQRRAAEGSNLP